MDLNNYIETLNELKFYKVLEIVYRKRNDYLQVLNTYLKGSTDRRILIFNQINEFIYNKGLKEYIIENCSELMELDYEKYCILIHTNFNYIENYFIILEKCKDNQIIQYLEFLDNEYSIDLSKLDQANEILKKKNCINGLIWIFEKQGNYESAFEKIIETLDTERFLSFIKKYPVFDQEKYWIQMLTLINPKETLIDSFISHIPLKTLLKHVNYNQTILQDIFKSLNQQTILYNNLKEISYQDVKYLYYDLYKEIVKGKYSNHQIQEPKPESEPDPLDKCNNNIPNDDLQEKLTLYNEKFQTSKAIELYHIFEETLPSKSLESLEPFIIKTRQDIQSIQNRNSNSIDIFNEQYLKYSKVLKFYSNYEYE